MEFDNKYFMRISNVIRGNIDCKGKYFNPLSNKFRRNNLLDVLYGKVFYRSFEILLKNYNKKYEQYFGFQYCPTFHIAKLSRVRNFETKSTSNKY